MDIKTYYCISIVIHHLGGRDDPRPIFVLPILRVFAKAEELKRLEKVNQRRAIQRPGTEPAPSRQFAGHFFGMGFEWEKKWDSNGKRWET